MFCKGDTTNWSSEFYATTEIITEKDTKPTCHLNNLLGRCKGVLRKKTEETLEKHSKCEEKN